MRDHPSDIPSWTLFPVSARRGLIWLLQIQSVNTPTKTNLLRAAALLALAAGSLVWSGCSTMDGTVAAIALPTAAIAQNSPAPEVVTPYQAIENARAYVKAHPGADYAIGSGDSMLPLYKDHAVIVTERPALSELKLGQTVMFMGQNGVPVAHTLIRHTAQGWVTMGLGNPVPDEGTLAEDNYMGVVVKAYQPTGSPILAYARTAPAGTFASNP